MKIKIIRAVILVMAVVAFTGVLGGTYVKAEEDTSQTEQTAADSDESNTLEYSKLSQLSGKIVAIQNGSTLDAFVERAVPKAQLSYFNTRTDTLTALRSNKVDALPIDEPVAKLITSKYPNLGILPEKIAEDSYGIALQKNSPLTAQMNDAIAQFKEDGTLEKLKEKWLGADESKKNLPQMDYPGNNGVLKVVYDSNAEPMGYFGESGRDMGHDLELMLYIGKLLDRRIEFVGVDFSALLPMLQSGKADAAVGCISITDERKEMVDMTDSYYEGGTYFVVRKAEGAADQTKESVLERLKAGFIRNFITENRWKLIVKGLEVTIIISIGSGIAGSILGFGICMLRRSKRKVLSGATAVFIRIIQGTPIVVILMILYYIIFGKMDVQEVLIAIVGFSVNFGVYVSEMMRTGIDAVDKGQIEAAYALGFTKSKAFWKITFPQAARHFLPVFQGEFISMVKMTSVVGYIAIHDLTKASDMIRSRTMEAFFPLIITAVIYFLVANILTILMSRLEVGLDPKRRKRTVKGVVMK